MEAIKINYQKLLEKELSEIREKGIRPKLLLHACCGPCLTLPYKEIGDFFDITIIYNNSNIYPEEEYVRRLNELKKYLQEIGSTVQVIEFPYDNENYNRDLEPLANDREGNDRCRLCFRKRLSFGYQYAADHGFDYYGTVMTISRYKNSQDLNRIGEELSTLHPGVKWLYADFKKNDGYMKSKEIVKEHHLYFQEYCGCKYSYQAYQKKIAARSDGSENK